MPVLVGKGVMDSRVVGDESVIVLVARENGWRPSEMTGDSACWKEEGMGLLERKDVIVLARDQPGGLAGDEPCDCARQR